MNYTVTKTAKDLEGELVYECKVNQNGFQYSFLQTETDQDMLDFMQADLESRGYTVTSISFS